MGYLLLIPVLNILNAWNFLSNKFRNDLFFAGYVLSKEALRRFVVEGIPDHTKCRQDNGGSEDVEIGWYFSYYSECLLLRVFIIIIIICS